MQVAVQILTPVLLKYGFAIDQAGGMQFLAAACLHKQDPAVVSKAQAIKAKFIPPELVRAPRKLNSWVHPSRGRGAAC